jgi:WD40 repeat protein/serine/threonine protein kinase/tetratricopeptide (TPR) repeat protein
MSASGSHSEIVLALAEEFLERYRQGQRPSLKEYTDRHPELAAEIREVFPAMALMENIALADESLEGNTASRGRQPPETLQQLGDYRIIREVGRGGMGVVYEAEQVSLGRHVALKVLPRKMLLDGRHSRRFVREARAAARLHHTNIVPVFGVGEQDGMPYYVMQFIQGRGLDEVTEELRGMEQPGQLATQPEAPRQLSNLPHRDFSAADVARSLLTGDFQPPVGATVDDVPRATEPAGPPPGPSVTSPVSSSSVVLPGQSEDAHRVRGKKPTYWQSVAQIGVQVAGALEHAHGQGILHRDIKPSNLLLDLRGTVWVTDFGLAKAEDQQNLTDTGDILGTLRYMPPEAFEGKSDRRGDLYALGLTLYELLALRPAFDEQDRHRLVKRVTTEEPERLERLNPRVPRDLVTIVHKAIDRDLGHRYASAAEMAADLQRFIDDEPIQARRRSAVERLLRWARRHKGVAAALSAVAVLLVLLTAGALLAAATFRRQEREQRALAERSQELALEMGQLAEEKTRLAGEKERERAQAVEARYYAEMNLAGQAADSPSGIGRVGDLLAPWRRSVPDLRGWEWYYLHGLCHRDQLTLCGHGGGVRAVAWSRDGARLASAGDDGTVKVWEAANGKNPFTLRGHAGRVYSVAWSPDGTRLASAGGDGMVKVWTAATGQQILTLRGHTGEVESVAWSPDGTRLASASADSTVKVWEAATGNGILTLRGHADQLLSVAWSPDGRRLASAGGDATVKLWEAATGKEILALRGHDWRVKSVAWSPDGARLASASQDQTVKVWDVATGKDGLTLSGHSFEVFSVAWSPDGTRLASASQDGTVKVWDATSGKETCILRGHAWGVESVAWSPDGTRLASAGGDRTVKVWDAASGQETLTLRGHGGRGVPGLYSVAWSPDGTRLASAGGDRTMKVWDAATGKDTLTLRGHGHQVFSVAWDRDGRRLASASGDRTVKVWDAATGKDTLTLPGHAGEVYTVAWSPDGRRLASGGEDRTVRLWDPASGTETLTLHGHAGGVQSVAWSPDGTRLASASWDQTVKVWELASGKDTFTLRGHTGGVHSVAWSPDGTRLASAGGDATVRLWEAANGKQILTLRGHTNPVWSVAWSPDGTRLASASQDRTVKVWDVATGKDTLTLHGHTDRVLCVVWSRDGTRLVSASGDQTILIHDATLGYVFERSPRLLPALGQRLAAEPTNVKDRQLRAAVYVCHGDWDRAAADVRQYLALSQDKPRLYMIDWWVVGPYPEDLKASYPPEHDPKPSLPVAAATPEAATTPVRLPWQVVPRDANGFVDFGALFDHTEHISGYALTQVYSPEKQAVAVLLGSDDGVRLWLNGHLIHENPASRTAAPDQDAVLVTLEAGWNTLLAKVVNGTGEHALYLRLSAEPADLARTLIERGDRLEQQKEWQTAVADYTRALELKPDLLEAYRHRGRCHTELAQLDKAAADFAQALAQTPERPNPWWPESPDVSDEVAQQDDLFARVGKLRPNDRRLRIARVQRLARHGLWRGASAALARVIELDPSDPTAWYRQSTLLLELRDIEGYRRVCREMLARFGQTKEPSVAEGTAKTCLFVPDAVPDLQPVLKLAGQAVTGTEQHRDYDWFLLCRGMADYRAGRFTDAIDLLKKVLSPNDETLYRDTLVHLFLAMAHQRLGQADEARQALDTARTLMEQRFPKPEGKGLDNGWDDWLRCQIVRREAEQLIDGKPQPADADKYR